MNKKGQITSEAIFLMWRLVLIFVLSLAIVLPLTTIFSAKYDVRGAENVLISRQIMDCISEKGIVNAEFELSNCILEEEHYIKAVLQSFNSAINESKKIGKEDFEIYCKLKKAEQPVSCLEQRHYVLIKKGETIERGMLDLLIATAKFSENIK